MNPIQHALRLRKAGWVAGFKAEGKYWVRKNSSENPCAVKRVSKDIYRLMLNMQYEETYNSNSS